MQRLVCGMIAAVVGLAGTSAADPARPADARTAEAELPALQSGDPGPGCMWLGATARPIGVSHFQDPALQQTAGTLVLRRGKDPARHGAVLATIVGQEPDGALRGNHHFVFADGVVRSKNDRVAIKPTSDKCRFEVESAVYVVDGTGAFSGLTGTLAARGAIDMCGGPGLVTIAGKLCRR